MEIFQQVAVMKGNGKIFPEIKQWLENEFGTPESNGEQGSEVLPSTPESKREPTPDHTTLLISTLKESQQRELETKDKMINMLTGNVKLLEEGRERRQQREDALRQQVTGLNSQITTEQEKRRQRKTLYAKLANLNGWSQRKERTTVLKQIEELDTWGLINKKCTIKSKRCGIKSKRGVVSSPKNRVENLNKPFKYNAKIRTTNQLILTSYTNLLYLT